MSRPSRRARSHARNRGRGRVFFVLGLAVALVAGLAALLWGQTPSRDIASDVSAPGRLVAVQSTVDLRRVPFDRMTEARFELDNTGGDVVRLVGAPKVRMLEGC
jgi:hypothetical protein